MIHVGMGQRQVVAAGYVISTPTHIDSETPLGYTQAGFDATEGKSFYVKCPKLHVFP